jgi:hypothetical protein
MRPNAEVSVYEGDFQNHRWHPECWAASLKVLPACGEEEFMPHSFKRGTGEEA